MNTRIKDLEKRLQYWIDGIFSQGATALIVTLIFFTIILVLVGSSILLASNKDLTADHQLNFVEALWVSLLTSLGFGSVAGRGTAWSYRLITLFLTLASIFIVSNLIGIITTAIQTKITNLRQGRSVVLERGHTVILGWSEQIFPILQQLIAANKSQRVSVVVVMGMADKVEMDEQIHHRLGNHPGTRIICRRGNPIEMSDLRLTSFNTAHGIIVLPPGGANPDAEVVKTVMAITKHPNRRSEPYHIVATLRDGRNYDIARVAGKGEVEWILASDVIARIIAQTCRQPGLSVAYNELLDFTGDEIYFHENASSIGKTFQETLATYEKAAVVGVQLANGRSKLNPSMNTILNPGDRLILIAPNDNSINLVQGKAILSANGWTHIGSNGKNGSRKENTIILGWNHQVPQILRELDHYVKEGSRVCVVSNHSDAKGRLSKIAGALQNLKVEFERADIGNRERIEALKLDRFEHVILLSNNDELSVQQADSHTLFNLLLVRDIAEKNHLKFSVVTEILDVRNSRLAEVTRVDDFIVSDRLVSLMMAQIAMEKYRNAVYNDLFDAKGSEIYLKPVSYYTKPGLVVNFYSIVAAAAQRSEVAFGYRLASQVNEPAQHYGVVLNPTKSKEIVFGDYDRIIVMAEK